MFNKVNVEGMNNEVSGYSAFKGILQQANTAFGQGITVNVMQMMQGFSAIANNGKMMKPYIIDKVTDNQGKTIQKVTPKKVGQPIKASTSKKVVKMMEGVIYDQKGLGHDYQIDGYKIAGKNSDCANWWCWRNMVIAIVVTFTHLLGLHLSIIHAM